MRVERLKKCITCTSHIKGVVSHLLKSQTRRSSLLVYTLNMKPQLTAGLVCLTGTGGLVVVVVVQSKEITPRPLQLKMSVINKSCSLNLIKLLFPYVVKYNGRYPSVLGPSHCCAVISRKHTAGRTAVRPQSGHQ